MGEMSIAEVDAWEALDSRGSPTVACEVRLEGGGSGVASMPSGASTGTHEARELRDGGDRYDGLGVRGAVRNVVEVLGPRVRGMDAADQGAVDAALRELDGTPNLARLGANAVLAVSVATALAHADARGEPLWRCLTDADPVLPLPMVNIVSGGAHAGGVIDIQDVLVVPVGAESCEQAIEWAWRVRRGAADALRARGLATELVADEGGLGAPLDSNRAALEVVIEGVERAGLEPGDQVALAVDVAANAFLADGRYRLEAEHRELSAAGWITELADWCEAFPLVSIEDPLADEDWDGWADASRRLGPRTQLLGDDLFVTDADRLQRGIEAGIANAILIKPNQVGTLTDAALASGIAHEAGYATVVSGRSGDTEDAWLADLAIAWGPGQVKIGSVTRSERTAKWNRLRRIEHQLGPDARFAGPAVLGRNPAGDPG